MESVFYVGVEVWVPGAVDGQAVESPTFEDVSSVKLPGEKDFMYDCFEEL
jgi:hypothetical protein